MLLAPGEAKARRADGLRKWRLNLSEEKKKELFENQSARMKEHWKNKTVEESSEILGKLNAARRAAREAPIAREVTQQTIRGLIGRSRYDWMNSTSTATTSLAGAAALSARPAAPQQGSGSRAPQTPGPGTSQPAAPGHHMTPSPAQSRGR
ncbi:hypothetical protein ACFV2D_34560 [Streptomyces capillispiralis]|uniref:hypothetical protein n=1 Tax=Streptomyces capillispiralis TaxID=68182 RepID=UPI0036BFEDBC